MTWTWKQASNTPHFVLKNKLNKILKKSLHWWSTFTPTDQKGHKGGSRRAYGWPWIHRTSSWLRLYWTNSLWILPSKPNSWRYRFSSLVFFFLFAVVVAFYCVVVVALFCFVLFGFSVFISRSFLEYCEDTNQWKKTFFSTHINSDSLPGMFHFFPKVRAW